MAIVAVLIGAVRWVVEMRTRSALYDRRAFEFAWSTACLGSIVTTKDGRRVSRYDDENDWLEDAWACKMAKKYWRLSDYPALPVGTHPPPPERLAHPRRAIDLPVLPPSFGLLEPNVEPSGLDVSLDLAPLKSNRGLADHSHSIVLDD